MAQRINRSLRKGTGLIETSLPILRAMKGHWHHEHLGGSPWQKLRNCFRKHCSKISRRRTQTIIFQCVNRIAQSAVVSAKGHSSCKCRRCQPASAAEMSGLDPLNYRRIQRVAAFLAHHSCLNGYLGPAGFANWDRRESRQRGAAKRT
jgi:hypothetical protein